MTGILWQPPDESGAERAIIERTSDGFRIAGTTLLVVLGAPYEIRYTVLTDPEWRTRTVGAHAQGPENDRRLALHSDGAGAWSAADEPIVDLYGATDVDLSWTPATNTIAIRRLRLEVGDRAEVVAAYVAFPTHEVRRVRQRYTRSAADTYRYESGDVSVDLTVDADGIVLDYPGSWRAVATG